MKFVDEKNDLTLGIFDFLENGLQAVLKFAAIFCAREHAAEIERDHAFVLKHLRHIARDDALG